MVTLNQNNISSSRFLIRLLPHVYRSKLRWSHTYSNLMVGFGDGGELDKAWALLKEMKSKGVKLYFTMFDTLLKVYRPMAKMWKAKELIRERIGGYKP